MQMRINGMGNLKCKLTLITQDNERVKNIRNKRDVKRQESIRV